MIALFSVAALLAFAPPALPSDSLYLVEDRFEDHSGRARTLADFRGQTVLLAMFYARCPQACPLLISDVKRVLAALPPAERDVVKVVLVTLDPERDTPAFLATTMTNRSLPTTQWTLMRTDAAATRTLSAVLGVRYRDGVDGAIDHTSQIALLDREGRKIAVRGEIGAPVEGFAKVIVDVVRKP
ncbi:MAG: SCO family protein [Deltaproteobacteria bacterium]|nr:SCO family protein [Deltaproteobacteria bacterium]